MRNLFECFERCSAHTLSGGIQRNKIRESRLQSDQFLVKPVVLAIADYRRGFVIIETVVLPDLVSQLLETLCSLRFVFSHETRYKRAKARQSHGDNASGRAGPDGSGHAVLFAITAVRTHSTSLGQAVTHPAYTALSKSRKNG